MPVRDTSEGYGIVSRLVHWLMAIAIVALFALGIWMVDLDYYSPYYHSAPELHKSVGMLLLAALAFRFFWRLASTRPDDDDLSPLERTASRAVHWGFYPLLLALILSGYLDQMSETALESLEADGFLNKPVTVDRLRGEIARLLTKAR